MSSIVKIWAIYLLLVSSAQASQCLVGHKSLWFSNGMMTSRDSARKTLKLLKKTLKTDYSWYELAYNEDENIGSQMLEVRFIPVDGGMHRSIVSKNNCVIKKKEPFVSPAL